MAAAIASIEPMSSRCTGATSAITPTSGSAMAVSSAIWPGPRIPISSTSASVPAGASSTVSGSPISVLRFSRLATVRSRWASIAARMSLVDVFPTEPVIPTTGQPSARRHAVARRCSAASGSSAAMQHARWRRTGRRRRARAPRARPTRRPRAPAARSARRRRARRAGPTKRSPGPAARESMTARAGPAPGAAPARRAARPRRGATCSGDHARTQRLAGDGDVVERAPCGRPRTPGSARGPCRRRRRRRPAAASRDRALDRRAPVDRRARRIGVRRRPAAISAMIASGSSSAGCRR